MSEKLIFILVFALLSGGLHWHQDSEDILSSYDSDWLRYARIADADFWFEEDDEEIFDAIEKAHEQGISVILSWIESENLIPSEKELEFLRKVSSHIHENYKDMRIILYQAPLEVITPNVDMNMDSKVDEGKKSVFTEHPEWLQVGISGRYAVYWGSWAFWVGETDEDAWLCPNNHEVRELTLRGFRELAATGIDGIWIDVVMFQNTFGDWEEEWACHSKYSKELFKRETGLDIPEEIDWENEIWKKWVLWRQEKIQGFIDDLRKAARSVNPDIKIIVEHWHGFDVGSTKNAWSPIGLQGVTDVLAHEYHSATHNPEFYDSYNFLRDLAFLKFYHGVDKGHPTWILAYSQERESQKFLASLILEIGGNYYDTDYEDMAGSVDYSTRKEIFEWIRENQKYYYDTEELSNVALFYSKATMDFKDAQSFEEEGEFYREFLGISMMLLELHVPYEVLVELDGLSSFDALILPNVMCMSEEEISKIRSFVERGGKLLSTGKTFTCDEMGRKRATPLKETFGENAIFTKRLYGNEYFDSTKPYFWEYEEREDPSNLREEFSKLLENIEIQEFFLTDASSKIVILPFKYKNNLILKILNLEGISPGDVVPEKREIEIKFNTKLKSAKKIDFLSKATPLEIDENTVKLEVRDHTLLVLETEEEVQILSNSNDLSTAEMLSEFLEDNGVETKIVGMDQFDKTCERIVVLGGHESEDTGKISELLLTTEERNSLEKKGFGDIFFKRDSFRKNQKIVIVAGNEREDTRRVAQERRFEILRFFEKFPIKGVQIELEIFEEESVEDVISELSEIGVNTIFLRIFSYDSGVYFKTNLAPVERDLLSDVIHEAKKYDIRVYAWMTTLNMKWVLEEHPNWAVVGYDYERNRFEKNMSWWKRVSPFVPEHREYLKILFKDIAKYDIEGVMFQDDLYLTEYEDYSKFAKDAYEKEFEKELKPENMVVDGEYTEEFWNWSRWKAEELLKLTKEIMDEMHEINPNLKFVLDTFEDSISEPEEALAWFSQDVLLAREYGFSNIAVMSYHRDIAKWDELSLKEAIQKLKKITQKGIEMTDENFLIMKVQVQDFETGEPLSASEIDKAFQAIFEGGIKNFLYYPHINGLPKDVLKKYFNPKRLLTLNII
ncbi:MAG: poly-beta-1,6-N-acetyl-D-glucosamine N-deacetylase PgaB [Candidatus Methanofastidiosia archaeon]